ncbi:MAG: diguanylate cyclase [Desulfobulbaceae bacterium]|nr:diguanylate cyclase [Desulfobulbaceae bacterium]
MGIDFSILTTLKYRVLGGIFLVFFLAISMVLYGVWTFQRNKLIDMNISHAKQVGLTIVSGLNTSMLQNDRVASLEIIEDMIRTAHFSKISVVNKFGKIIMSSQPSLIGRVLNKEEDPTCLICHQKERAETKATAVISSRDNSYTRTIISIENKKECYACHAKDQKIIGILLVDSSLAEVNGLLHDMAQRIVMTGVFTFILGFFLISFIVTRFFTEPLESLKVGFEKIGQGNFNYWVDVRRGGEIAEMADSFNIMSKAIGRYVDEVKLKSKELKTLYSIVQRMMLTIEKKKLKEIVLDLLVETLDAECVTLVLPMEKKKNIFEVSFVQKGDKRRYHSRYNMDSTIPPSCSLTKKELADWLQRKIASSVISENGGTLLFPLQLNNLPVCLISVLKPTGESFSQQQKKIIPILAHHMTISFANAQLYELAITDELTTLYTKRYFLKEIHRFVEEYHVYKKGYCVMMLDLDYFKEVNDNYGHPVGDQVLVTIAELIRTSIRHGDIACRYGGEEFVVLFMGDNVREAVRVAERIRKTVEQYTFRINDYIEPFNKTVSIGLAFCPHDACSVNEIVVAADSALYMAKNTGRNRVVSFSDISPESN